MIGRHNRGETSDGDVFNTGALNGCLSGARIYAGALTPEAVKNRFQSFKPAAKPDFHIPERRFASDPQRPAFHPIPAAGWTNEPHGLFFWKGHYHLFYQENANGPFWGQIHWGHLQSADLLHWEQLPSALSPSTDSDQRGCWSGSVLEYKGVPTIFYTAVNGRFASICVAQSRDESLTK